MPAHRVPYGQLWHVERSGDVKTGVLSINRGGARPCYSGSLLHISRGALSVPLSQLQTLMMLARLTPSRHGFESQYFDCPKCDHELTMEVAEVRPLKKAEGWLSGELGQSPSGPAP